MRAELRAHLKDAMRARDKPAVSALRAALAAIENAEAVDVGAPGPAAAAVAATTTSEHIAGAVAGLGAAEVERRRLTDEDVIVVVVAEVARLDEAASEYEDLGRPDEAAELRQQAAVLRGHLV